jgi:hypothetical protein
VVSLVAKSMVVADEDEAGGTRYQLLETLRQYARERLDESGAADDGRRRHAVYYAEFAEAIGPRLRSSNEIAARRRLRAEVDDLRAAINWAVDSDAHSDLAVRIVAAIASEAMQDQRVGVGAWAMRVAPVSAVSTPGLRMAVLGAAATHAVTVGDYALGERLALDSVLEPIPSDCPDPTLTYLALSQIEAYQGRPEVAYRVIDESRRTIRQSAADAYAVTTMFGLAAVWAFTAGDVSLACAEGEEALRRARAVECPSVLCAALFELGWALSDDDPERALAMLEESIALTRGGAGDSTFAPALGVGCVLRARAGDLIGAFEFFAETVEFTSAGGLRTTLLGSIFWGVELLVYLERLRSAAVVYGIVREGPLEAGINRYSESPQWVKAVETCRSVLGADGFAAEAARGAAMTYEQVEAYMRAEIDALRPLVTDA